MTVRARGIHPFFDDPWQPAPAPPPSHSPAEVAAALRGELADVGVKLTCTLPARPLTLPRRSYDELFGAAKVLLGLVRRAVLSLGATWPDRLVALGADPAGHPLLSALETTETDFCAMMARADVVVGETGPRLLGFHVGDAFDGLYETHAFTRVWRRTHVEAGQPVFAGHDPLAARADAFEDVCARRGLPRALALVAGSRLRPGGDRSPARGAGRRAGLDLEEFRARGFEAALFTPEKLPGAPGRTGRPRYALGLRSVPPGRRSPLPGTAPPGPDRPDRPDGPVAPDEPREAAGTVEADEAVEAVRAARRAGLLLLPPRGSGLLADKRALALVSEGLPWMTRGERELVDHWLPWTRISLPGRTSWHGTEQELPELLLADREHFVLKSAAPTAGRPPLLGRECGAREWAAAVERAFREGDSVAQEYVESAGTRVELTDGEATWMSHAAPVLSPMLFGGRPGGCWVRSRPADGGMAQNAVLTWGGGR